MGKIVKERPGNLSQVAKELATDADNFTMYVEKNMDVKKKATMLAALHLIDYMFFENEGELKLDAVNKECSFKCCDLYCCGCVCPCSCNCGGDSDDDEDGVVEDGVVEEEEGVAEDGEGVAEEDGGDDQGDVEEEGGEDDDAEEEE